MSDCKMDVIQVVAGFPPDIDGVGHYALLIAQRLRELHGINTHFVVCKLNWQETEQIDGFPTHKLTEHSFTALLSVLEKINRSVIQNEGISPTILLQLSAYGYDKNACPYWLASGLQSWKAGDPNRKLITMFHELYAFGPPWKKAFWLSPFQRMVASRIVCLSDVAFTNMQRYANKLIGWDASKERKVKVLPVFSNMGEPKDIPPLHDRSKRLIVFGQRANRLRVYRDSFEALIRVCRGFDIEEIYDIGQPIEEGLPQVDNVKVVQTGILQDVEISRLLLDSRIGFFEYFPEYLAKSGVFAVYCAHGLLPVSGKLNSSELDGLVAEEQYWTPTDNQILSIEQAQKIADKANQWYMTHTLSKQVDVFADTLMGVR